MRRRRAAARRREPQRPCERAATRPGDEAPRAADVVLRDAGRRCSSRLRARPPGCFHVRMTAPSSSSDRFVAARVRVTLDCPECASPVPVNGIVDEVLCGACQSVFDLEKTVGWSRILAYTAGEPCAEHSILVNSRPMLAMEYFLAFGLAGGALHRRWQSVMLEVDGTPPTCPACKHALDVSSLGREAAAEGSEVGAFCPGCGGKLAIRAPRDAELSYTHTECVAIVGETAPRTGLREPEAGEKVLFSCLGCGAPSGVDATTPRIMRCAFCSATSYLPDALWLRLHPTQRKKAFHLILRVGSAVLAKARKTVKG